MFGVRSPDRHMVGGGAGANLAAIVYDVGLTLGLPREETVGTSLNALARGAEALYAKGRNDAGDAGALAGAALIAELLPRVVAAPRDVAARTGLLRGAASAGEALALAGLALAHAMAQALGGRYGIAHGAANALCLPPALRFNEPVAADEIRRFGDALGTDEPDARVEELARASGFTRLRDLDVPEDELDEVAEAAAGRAGAKANPRTASPEEIAGLLRSIW
jgi:alcohol dehydrogenase class IV